MTLMETFKLYLWCMWKSGVTSDDETKQILKFMDGLTEKETVSWCLGQLDELK